MQATAAQVVGLAHSILGACVNKGVTHLWGPEGESDRKIRLVGGTCQVGAVTEDICDGS